MQDPADPFLLKYLVDFGSGNNVCFGERKPNGFS